MKKYIYRIFQNRFKRAAVFCVSGWLLYESGLLLYIKLVHENGGGNIFAVICFLCGLVTLHGFKELIAAKVLSTNESIFANRLSMGSVCILSSAVVGTLSGFALVAAKGFGLCIILPTVGAVLEIFGGIEIFKARIGD